MGLDLAMYNQKNVLNAIKEFKNNINEIEVLIKEKNWELLSKKLTQAMETRTNFIS